MPTTHRFAIMLDNWLEVYPTYWAITASFSSLASARKAARYNGTNPRLKSRNEYRAEVLENKSLVNSRTGSLEAGAIYSITRKQSK